MKSAKEEPCKLGTSKDGRGPELTEICHETNEIAASPSLCRSHDAHSWESGQCYFWARFMQVPSRASAKRKRGGEMEVSFLTEMLETHGSHEQRVRASTLGSNTSGLDRP